MLLKVVIAEDDEVVRKQLINIISSFEDFDIVYSTGNGTELLNVLPKIKPDILISDIDMPGMTGIEVIKVVRNEIPNTEVVFVTAYDQYIKQAIQLYAFDFIEKPFNVQRLKETLERIRMRIITNDRIIELKSGDTVMMVRIKDLYLVEAVKKKTRIFVEDGNFMCNMSLKEVEELITAEYFFKTGRSYIVNLKKISSIAPFSRTSFQINFEKKDYCAFLSKTLFSEFRTRLKKYHN